MQRLAFVVLLLSTVAAAEPVVIGPSSPAKAVSDADWRPLYDAAKARAGDIKAVLGSDIDITRKPLTTAEEQCLLNRLIRGDGVGLLDIIRRVGSHPLVAHLGGVDRAAVVVSTITRALGGSGDDDWCERLGPSGRNRGLFLYVASQARGNLDARITAAIRAKGDEMTGRPLTWAEVVSLAGAVAFGVGSLAVP